MLFLSPPFFILCLYFCSVYTSVIFAVSLLPLFVLLSCLYFCLYVIRLSYICVFGYKLLLLLFSSLHRGSERNVNLICAECLLSYFCFPSPPSPFIRQRGWKLQFFSLAPSPQYLHSMGITGNNLQRYCLSNAPLTLCIPRPINKQSRGNTATGFKPINCPTG